jgi:hypothetical protein
MEELPIFLEESKKKSRLKFIHIETEIDRYRVNKQ